ncbi:ESPR-type extended signal peptide-containing protein, partial [Psychrobacter alimentarius]
MNRSYKVIWNQSLNCFMAVAEYAKSRGKSSSNVVSSSTVTVSDGKAVGGVQLLRLSALSVGLISAGLSMQVMAAPSDSDMIAQNTADITINRDAIAINTSDIATNKNTIATNTNDIVTNRNAIATNAGNIDTNKTNIAANTNAISTNTTNIAEVRRIASAGWNISAEGGTPANVPSGGTVDFSSDPNLVVSRNGTNLTFGLANNIAVESLDITNGPSITSAGINAANKKITNVGDGEISATSMDVINGRQINKLLFESGTAEGIRYFRANTILPDAMADGLNSVAIGPEAKTTEFGESAIALGQSATAGGESEGGEGAIAIGRNSSAQGNSSLALGDAAQVTGASNATAIGKSARTSAGNATAVGANSVASGSSSFAAGYNSKAEAANTLAAGTDAYAGTARSIALGSGAGVGTVGNLAGDRTDHIALGTNAGTNVVGNRTTAIGYNAGQNVIGDDNVAFGTEAGSRLTGDNNVSIGANANNVAESRSQSVAIGNSSRAGTNSVALGSNASAAGDETVALGKDAQAGVNGVALGALATAEGSNIALGRNSQALNTDAMGSGYLTGSSRTESVISVGSSVVGGEFQRRIVNVADGSQRYDAVNVGQLKRAQDSITPLIGGGVVFDEATGTYSGITIDNTQYNSVADAIAGAVNGQISSAALPEDVVRYQGTGSDRRISNVAKGQAATDVVNVGQLNEAITENGTKYFSVNTVNTANRQNDGASGADALAIGPAAVAGGNSSLSVGHTAVVDSGARSGVAIGNNVNAKAVNSTAIGNNGTAAYGQGGIAVGQQAVSQGRNSIVMGTGAEADFQSGSTVDNAIVIGTRAEVTANNGIAIGEQSLSAATRATAQGFNAKALAVDSQAFGTNAETTGINSQARGTSASASGRNAQASGTNAAASGTSAVANGTDAKGLGTDSIAIGTSAVSGFTPLTSEEAARNRGSIAIGDRSTASELNALALGVLTRAEAESATAIGDRAVASANKSLAVGFDSDATAQNASAFGQSAQALAMDSLALGSGARATAINATAIGRGAEAVNARSVALGDGARTQAAVGTSDATIDRVTYTYAGTTPIATVSVGTLEGEKRTITNVAAGRVSDTSTDAINGSQLFRTNQAVTSLGNNLDTVGQSVASSLGGTSSYNTDNHTVSTRLQINGNNYTTVQQAVQYAASGWNVSANGAASQNIAPNGTVDFRNTDSNIAITRTGSNLTFNLSPNLNLGSTGSVTTGNTVTNNEGVRVANGANVATLTTAGTNVTNGTNTSSYGANGLTITNGPSVTSTGINAAGSRITNVANGTANTDAANFGQVKAAKTQVAAGTNVTNVAETTGTNGESIYTVNADKSTVSGGSNAVTVTAGTKNANNVTDYAVDLSADTKTSLSKADTAVQTVSSNDPNLTATKTGNNVVFDFADAPTFTGVVKGNGFDASGVKIVNVADGSIAANSKEAINGSQLFTTAESVKTVIGGN